MVRSIPVLLWVAVLGGVVAACGAEEPYTPKLRKGGTTTGQESTEPVKASEEAAAASTPAVDAAPPAPVEVYLSDIDVQVIANGYGPLERNMSCGDIAANDGKMISIRGVTHSKGLGAHANAEVVVPLAGGYKSFLADVGVDDEVGANGSVVFQVIVDGEMLFDRSGQVLPISGNFASSRRS